MVSRNRDGLSERRGICFGRVATRPSPAKAGRPPGIGDLDQGNMPRFEIDCQRQSCRGRGREGCQGRSERDQAAANVGDRCAWGPDAGAGLLDVLVPRTLDRQKSASFPDHPGSAQHGHAAGVSEQVVWGALYPDTPTGSPPGAAATRGLASRPAGPPWEWPSKKVPKKVPDTI